MTRLITNILVILLMVGYSLNMPAQTQQQVKKKASVIDDSTKLLMQQIQMKLHADSVKQVEQEKKIKYMHYQQKQINNSINKK